MITVDTVAELRTQVAAWRASGERIAFVPTMGNLHAGHIALVQRARELATHVVASIFVNPLQFGAGEDFATYPRTPAEDAQKLRAAGAELLFAPSEREMYPRGREGVTQVEVPGLSDELCGAYRPGHFRGVATVVCKLFNVVQPDVAVFGQKDYQQLTVLRRMAEDLCFPVDVVGVSTVREPDGLAMSSRNGYLSADERAKASGLYRTLRRVAKAAAAGVREWSKLESEAMLTLEGEGFRPDYVAVRRAGDLACPGPADRELVVLAAAWMGRTRLIDNLLIRVQD